MKDLSIPWRTSQAWSEAIQTLEFLAARHESSCEPACAIAKDIKTDLESLFPGLDILCRLSCRWCPDSCCLKASVYMDFRDLLFLVLTKTPPPPGQMRLSPGMACTYSSPRGCELPRIQRPWICTWYLCAEQKALVRQWPEQERERFLDGLERIRSERKRMEELFISAVI